MPRISRSVFSKGFFHIMSQGINKSFIFKQKYLKKEYLYLIKKFSKEFNIIIIAYCIMDNHAHLLLYSDSISNISSYMQKINSSFAKYYNYKNNRVGYVFRDRFLSEYIKDEKQLYTCIKYIHMNPVKAKIVKNEQDYEFSSYKDYLYNKGIFSSELLNLVFYNDKNYVSKFLSIKNNDTLYFLEVDSDTIPSSKRIENFIQDYLNNNNLNIHDIKYNKKYLYDICFHLVKKLNIKQKEIAKYFNLHPSTISKILKNRNT